MTAWEITSDDVEIVLRAHGLEFSDDRIQAICDELDHDEIIDRLLNLTDLLGSVQGRACSKIINQTTIWKIHSSLVPYQSHLKAHALCFFFQ